MHTTLVITLITDDRPGLIGELSALVSAHDANWLESSFAQLASKFAGIIRLSVPAEKCDALLAALRSRTDLKLNIEAVTNEILNANPDQQFRSLALSLIGHDRIGIVREITQVLAGHGINIERFDSAVCSGAMSAELMFEAELDLQIPAPLDISLLQADLERLSADLMVDIKLSN